MTYSKRVYTNGIEDVTYQDMNRIEEGIYQADKNKVDKVDGKGLSTNDYTTTEKNKLAGIANGANNYVHPTTHDASIIAESATKRFVTDVEKSTWNDKETTAGSQVKADTALTSAKEYADGKVKLNGESTNVNFIRNDVVQDGLISGGSSLTSCIAFVKTPQSIVTGATYDILNKYDAVTTMGWKIYIKENGDYWYGRLNTGGSVEWKTTGVRWESGDLIIAIDNGKEFFVYKNNLSNLVITRPYSQTGDISCTTNTINKMWLYKSLTQQQLHHNLSVLNNSPSINRINDYVIASDTDHVTDSGSILQSKINRVFYKQNCKEFTSNGEAISVNNGMDGYVLSAKIEGNTKVFKALKGTQDWVVIESSETRDTNTYDYKLESTKAVIRVE